jgi:subtilase family serine protease
MRLGVFLSALAALLCGWVWSPPTVSGPVVGQASPLHSQPYHIGSLARQPDMIPCARPGAWPRCYTPAELQAAYGVTPLLSRGITGAGPSIGIVDAYGSPTLAHDLALFDRTFHLRAAHLVIAAPQGMPSFDPNNLAEVDWAGETTLDVEWAHAIAPGARIVLIVARSNADADLLAATRWAVEHLVADDLSMSFGEAEACAPASYVQGLHQVFALAVRDGITPIAAAGDSGAALPDCHDRGYHKAVSYPASDPYVLSVGGTHLVSPAPGGERLETVWNNGLGATGGGYSTLFPRPYYQAGVMTSTRRGVPDVASDADPATGVLVVWSSSGQGADQIFTYGGTSAGAPVWAGIIALAAQYTQHDLGWVNVALYAIMTSPTGRLHDPVRHPMALPFFHDITSGTNTVTVPNANGTLQTITGYAASVGWDAVSGWGSPDVQRLVPALASL